jgi:type II secretory pathway component PulF
MPFPSRLSLSSLIELCRVLRHYVGGGLSLVEVFRQQASRGPGGVRPVAGRIAAVLEGGGSLQQALKREEAAFPPLFLALAGVGEQTGMLPEVFGELERYFQGQQALRRQFLARSAWPILQFVLATLVLAVLIFVMGTIGSGPEGQRFDPLGLGLFGASGALIFLGAVWGTIFGLAAGYLFLTRSLRQRAAAARFLLGLPALGPCLRALALGRFCLALRLTTESGMSIHKALRLSLRATGNAAFAERSPVAEESVKQGEDLTLALASTGMVPADFQRMLAVAEESGRLSEVLRHQGDHYQEEAARRLAFLTSVASYAVWAVTGLFIIVAIFRIYTSYLDLLKSV